LLSLTAGPPHGYWAEELPPFAAYSHSRAVGILKLGAEGRPLEAKYLFL